MSWDKDSFKIGFAIGRGVWNQNVKKKTSSTTRTKPESNQNEEEGNGEE